MSKLHFPSQKNNKQCSDSCSTPVNCCITSNPCANGGTCASTNPQHHERRFTCKCPDGYTGKRCEKPITSCRDYKNGDRVPGVYKVLDANMFTYEVFCDFDPSSKTTWTLVQSYERSNRTLLYELQRPLFEDRPVFEQTPSWSAYRLSKSRMETVQKASRLWRMSCEYDKRNMTGMDYVQGSNDTMNILSVFKESFFKVERGEIGDRADNDCHALFTQAENHALHLQFYNTSLGTKIIGDDSTARRPCNFGTPDKLWCNGNIYFAFLNLLCLDLRYRCLASFLSTTQIWLGN